MSMKCVLPVFLSLQLSVAVAQDGAGKLSTRLLELSDSRSELGFVWDRWLNSGLKAAANTPLIVRGCTAGDDDGDKTPGELLDEAIDHYCYDLIAGMDQTLKGQRLITAVQSGDNLSEAGDVFHALVMGKTTDNKAVMTYDDSDANGLTALHHAVRSDQDYFSYNLIKGPSGVTPAVSANKDAVDLTGKTALHHAAIHGLRLQAHILLGTGASSSIADNDGKTPEDHAVAGGHLALANDIRLKEGKDTLTSSFTLVSQAADLAADGRYMIRLSNANNDAGMAKDNGRCLKIVPSVERTVADPCNPISRAGWVFKIIKLADRFGTDKYLMESAEQPGECIDTGELRRGKRFHLSLKSCIDITATNPSQTQIATFAFPAADGTDTSVGISFERDSATSNNVYMNGNSRNWTVKAGGDNGSQWEILEEVTDADGNTTTSPITGLATVNADQSYMVRLKDSTRCLAVLPLIERSVADTCDATNLQQWFTFEQVTSLGSSYFLIESAGTVGKCIDSGEYRRRKRFHLSAKACIDASASKLGRNQVVMVALPDGDFSGTSFVMSFEKDQYSSSTLHMSGNQNNRTVKADNNSGSRWEIFKRN